MSKITVRYDYVLLEPEEGTRVTPGGLYLSDKFQGDVKYGKVVAAGWGSYSATGQQLPMMVAVGDRAAILRGKGVETYIDGEKYLIVKEIDILYTIKDDD